jgi:hypothetical protein
MKCRPGDVHESPKQCIGLEQSCDIPRFDGTGPIDAFIAQMEDGVPEAQEDSGHGCSSEGNTCALVGDAPCRLTGLGAGGRVHQSKVPSPDQTLNW